MLTEDGNTNDNLSTVSNELCIAEEILYSRKDAPFGISWEEWTAQWWQWILSIPKQKNPGLDTNGETICLSEQYRRDNVVFLVGTFGGTAERTYTVPKDKAILLPVINFTFCSLDEPTVLSDQELRKRAQKDIDDIVEKFAIIDGKSVPAIEKYRVKSKPFEVLYPKNNVFGLSQGTTRAISDGYWLFLKPMESGHHDLHVSGSCSSGKTKIDVTLHLNVS